LGTGLAFGVAAIVWLVPYQAWSQGSFGDQVLGGHYLTWYLLGAILPRLTALYAPLVSFLPWTLLAAAAPVWWRQSPDAGWERVAIVALGLAACVVLVRGVRLGAPTTGAVGLALAMAGILLVEGITYPIRYTRAFDVRPLTVAAAANVGPGGTVVGYPGL